MNEPTYKANSLPDLSVLVPTHGRPEALDRLVECLSQQTLASDRFELVIVDDGGSPRADIDPAALPFRCNILRQPNAGPAAARNVGLGLCRAPLVLMLNDDAVPSEDLLESHLRAHRELGPGRAVLGTFRFTESARRSAFTRLLDESDLLFGFSALTHGRVLDWRYFWTCNISLSRDAILGVGGFDAERFDAAICEDVELGYRLQKEGVGVVYREDCRAEHEHAMTVVEYLRRASKLGKYSLRLARAHDLPGPAWSEDRDENTAIVKGAINYIEGRRGAAKSFVGLVAEMDRTLEGVEIPEELARDAKQALLQHSLTYSMNGAYEEDNGIDALKMMEEGPPAGISVGIVVVSCNALANTKRCIETLRAKADPRFTQTLYVTDNGSTDGSVEWLEGPGAGPDLKLIRNPFNHGAPRARNQALLEAGDHAWICFLDNDVFVTEGWLGRALYHGEVDPEVGSVSLCASRASKFQVVPYDGPDDQASLDTFANAHFAADPRMGKDANLFTSFGVFVRSEVLDRIGGFDEAFSPWGFEDDDLSLRIVMAGWRNRVARDTYVHHAAYGTEEKVARHDEWMRANWDTFLAKWSPEAAGSPLFDYSRVQELHRTNATEAQIRFDLPPAGAPVPEWAGCAVDRVTPGEMSEAPESMDDLLPAPRGGVSQASVPETGAPETEAPETGAPRSSASTGSLDSAVSGVLGSPALPPGDKARSNASAGLGAPGPDGPVFVVSPCARIATELARALGWNARPDPGMRAINEYLLAGTSLISADGIWIGDPLGEVPNALSAAPETEVQAVLQPGAVHADARLAATIPAWLDHVPGARVVFVVTDPSSMPAELREAAAANPECEGLEIDEGCAVGLWLRTTQLALELSREGRGQSRWSFVMGDDLQDPSTLAKIEAFTGLSLRASTTLGATKAASSESYPAVAPTYDAARAMARGEGTRVRPLDGPPDLSVILDLEGPAAAWAPCLESLERQSLDASVYEIVACCRETTSLDALKKRTAVPELRVLDVRGKTLGAARNAAIAESQGAYGIFVGSRTRPALDLLEQHVVALTAAGADRVIRGATVPFGESQGMALSRLLSVLRTPTGFAGEEPEALYEWPRFDTSNVCVSIEALRSVGLFEPESNDRAYLDAEIGYRLQTDTGARIVIAHGAATERLEPDSLNSWRDGIRQSYRAVANVVAQYPGALAQRDWRIRLTGTVDGHREMIRKTLEGRGRAEAFAGELAAVDVGALERAGEEGAEISEVLTEALAEYLVELDSLYRADGELQAFQDLGVTGFQELLESGGAGDNRSDPSTAAPCTPAEATPV